MNRYCLIVLAWLFIIAVCPIAASYGQASRVITELKPEDIKARIKQVESSTDLSPEMKNNILELYSKALEHLAIADSFASKALQHKSSRQGIPEEVARIKAFIQQVESEDTSKPPLEIDPEATLDHLAQKLKEAKIEFSILQQDAKKIEDDIKNYTDRKTYIPNDLVKANAALEVAAQQLSQSKGVDISPELAMAKRTTLLARLKAIKEEINTYNEELLLYNILDDFLTHKLRESKLKVALGQAKVTTLQEMVSKRRQADAEKQRQDTEKLLAKAPDAVKNLIKQNKKLIQEHTELSNKIDELNEQAKQAAATLDTVEKDLSSLQQKLHRTEIGSFVGQFLLIQKKKLPDKTIHKKMSRALEDRIDSVQNRLIDIYQKIDNLKDLKSQVIGLINTLKNSQKKWDRGTMRPFVLEILQTRRNTLESLIRDYEIYWDNLVSLNVQENCLISKLEVFEKLIDEHILWIPSSRPLFQVKTTGSFTPKKENWIVLAELLRKDIIDYKTRYIIILVVIVLMIILSAPVKRKLKKIDELVSNPETDSFPLTLNALFLELLLTVPLPFLLWFLSYRITAAVPVDNEEIYEFANAISQGIFALIVPLSALMFIVRLCRQGGVAESHFHWNPKATRRIYKLVPKLVALISPSIVFIKFIEQHPDEIWKDFYGRLFFIIAILLFGIFLHLLLRPKKGLFFQKMGKESQKWSYFQKILWYFFVFIIPSSLIISSVAGYHYTAMILAQNISRTMWIIIGLAIFYSATLRFWQVYEKKLALEKGRLAGSESSALESDFIEKKSLRIQESAHQLKLLINWVAAIALIIGIWGVWHDIFPAFSFMKNVELWSYTIEAAETAKQNSSTAETAGKIGYVYLTDLLYAILILILMILLSSNGLNVLETVFLARLPMDASLRFAIVTVLRYIIIVTGVALAFKAVGVQWAKVQWLAAAVTVGLGFGLQEIFANFVSGLIILFERPIRVGDTVTVGDTVGRVSRIQMRATTITDINRREYIIPNKDFITSNIINWTLSDPMIRVDMQIGVAYGSNTTTVRQLLLKGAQESQFSLDKPSPRAYFKNFDESSLDFELQVFIPHRDIWLSAVDDINSRIDREFRNANVEIPFPQRDIHIRTIKDDLLIAENRTEQQRQQQSEL